MPINFDPNSLNNVFDKNFGAGAYNSGISNAKKAAQLKTQANFAKSEFTKALTAYKAKQKKDQDYMQKYGMTYDDYQAKKEQDKLNKLQDKYQVLDNGLTSDQASKMRSKAEAQGRGGYQPSYDQQRKEAQKNTSNDLTTYDTNKMTDHNKELVQKLQDQQLAAQAKKQNDSKKSSPGLLSKIGNGLKGIGSEIGAAATAAEQFINPFDKVSADQAVKNYMNRTPSKTQLEVERGVNRAVDSASLGLMSNLDKKVNNRTPYYTSQRAFGQGGGTDMITSGLGYLVPGVGATKAVRALGLGAKEATGLAKFAQLAKEGAITGGGLMGAEQGVNWALNPKDQSIGNSLLNVGLGAGLGAVGDPLLHGIGQVGMNGLAKFAKGEVPTFTGKPSQSIMDALTPKKSPKDQLLSELNNNQEIKLPDFPLNPSKGIENVKPFDGFMPKQSKPDIANSPLLMSLNPTKNANKFGSLTDSLTPKTMKDFNTNNIPSVELPGLLNEPNVPKSSVLQDILKEHGITGNTPEDIAKAYNQRQWYHGTGTAGLTPDQLDPLSGNHEGLFGNGIYMTDNPEIANGYAKSRGRRTSNPTIYNAKVKMNRVLDLESPVPQDAKVALDKLAQPLDYIYNNEYGEPNHFAHIVEEMARKGSTTEEIFQAIRHELNIFSHQAEIPTSEFVETIQDFVINLKNQGYDGITHTGGGRTGHDPHRVLIALDPNDWYAQTGRTGQVTDFNPNNPAELLSNHRKNQLKQFKGNPDTTQLKETLDFLTKGEKKQKSDVSKSPLLMSLNPAKTAEKMAPKLTPVEQEYQNELQHAVKQQAEYLKSSMGKGVDRGTTSNGEAGNFKEVTGTFNVSRNPKWYQDFYKTNGRKPNKAELEQLAKEHVLGGFQDEFGDIPAFVPKKIQNINDQIDEALTNIQAQPELEPVLKPYVEALKQEKAAAEEEYNQFLMKLNLQQFAKKASKTKEAPKPVPGNPVPKDFNAVEHIGGLINREVKPKTKPTVKEKIKTMTDNTYIKMVDDFYGGTKLDKAAGKDITSQESATVNAHIAKGSGEKARQELERGYFDETGKKIGKSFNEIIQGSKNPDQLERYLVARSILDYDEKGMKAIKTGGLNQRQIAEKAIRDIEKQYPGIKNEAKDMYTFIKNQRNILTEGEMLNESQIKAMDKANKNYVPMERVHEDGIESFVNANDTLKKRYANVGDPMKKRTGSERDIVSPLQTLVKRQYIYNNMAERNKVGAAVLDNLTTLGKDNPFASIVGVEKNGAYKLVDVAGELAGKTEKEIPDSINSLFQDAEGKNNIVYVYKGGDKYKIQIKDKFLYESMMSLNVKQLPGWMKVLNYPTQILRAGVTLSPDFGLRNIFRDQITTAVTSKVGYKPFYDALKGASEIIKARKGKSPIVESYIRNGGSMSVLQNIDRTNIVKSYEDLVGNKTTREKLIGIAKDPLKWLEPMRKLGEFSEMSTRVGHYKRALNKGMSPKDATYLARSTMDFNRAGTWGRQINQGVAFFNASIQGLDVLARSIKDRPAETLKNIGLYVTLPTAALYMMNKDQDWYKEIPADMRDKNWYIPVGGQVLQLPKPFEVGILFGAGLERTLDKAFSEQDSPFKDFAKQIAATMTPDVIPTAVKPLVEVVTNHDFFTGQSIESLGDQSLNPADRYNAYNSQFAINTAKGLAALNPKSKVSPKQIDHLVRGYTGTLGSYVTEGADKITEAVNPNVPKKPSRGVQTAPFIRSFFVKNLEGNNRSVGDFYDSFDKFRQTKKSMENNGQVFPYAAQKKAVEKTMSAINKLQKSKKEVLNSNKIGAQQKADQIKQFNQRITELAKQGNAYKMK